jgi:hypothetical protein
MNQNWPTASNKTKMANNMIEADLAIATNTMRVFATYWKEACCEHTVPQVFFILMLSIILPMCPLLHIVYLMLNFILLCMIYVYIGFFFTMISQQF